MALKNIIFDFGNVICDIDVSLTEKAFVNLGIKPVPGNGSSAERDRFFEKFETGFITPEEFRKTLKKFFLKPVTDVEIDIAWNALLHKIPVHRIDLLKKLRSAYRLFLLSNTNLIHYIHYVRDLQDNFGFQDFHDLVETAFFSHEIHLRKPSREVFEYVLNYAGIQGEETLFIDDTLQHVEGARKAGLKAYHLTEKEDITDLFSPEMHFLRPL